MFIADYLSQELTYYENAELPAKSMCKDVVGVTEGCMIQYKIQKKEPLRAELEHFIDCVQNDKKPLISGRDGLLALAIAKNLIESSKTGRSI